MTVSFFVNPVDTDGENIQSSIKFGSMDRIGLSTKSMYLLRTANKNTWDIKCSKFRVGTKIYDPLKYKVKQYIRIEP